MNAKEIPLLPKLYDAIVWYSRKLAKYPKTFKYNIGERIMNSFLATLEFVIETQYASEKKSAYLRKANIELEKLRFLIRLSKDLQCISLDEYEHVSGLLVEMGKMIGGWEKYSRQSEKRIVNSE